ASGTREPVERRGTDTLRYLRCCGGERLVIVELDPEHPSLLCRSEPGGMEHSEGDRHLPEDVAGLALADDALDAVGSPQPLDSARQDAEQRPSVTLVDGELAGNERDVRRRPGKPVAFGRLEVREHSEPTDLLRCHHCFARG